MTSLLILGLLCCNYGTLTLTVIHVCDVTLLLQIVRTTRKVPEPDPAILRQALQRFERDDVTAPPPSSRTGRQQQTARKSTCGTAPRRMRAYWVDAYPGDYGDDDDDDSDYDDSTYDDDGRGPECVIA